MRALTERQAEALSYIVERYLADGVPPTIRSIGRAMRIRSTNGVRDHLLALERKGCIRPQANDEDGAIRAWVPVRDCEGREVRVVVGCQRCVNGVTRGPGGWLVVCDHAEGAA